jgi:hypothetical protein
VLILFLACLPAAYPAAGEPVTGEPAAGEPAAEEPAAEVYRAEAGLAAGRLTVLVALNGVGPYPFAIDTALRLPVVDAGVAAFLELAEAPTESGEANRAILDSLEVAGLPAQTMSCVVSDLSALSARLGVPIAGLLPAYQPGYEITLDYLERTVTWRPASESILFAQPGNTVSLEVVEHGAPRAGLLLNGGRLEACAIDTMLGEFITLPWSVLEAAGANRAEAPTVTLRTVSEAAEPITFTRLAEARLGDISVENALLTVGGGLEPALGIRFLSRFRVTLNFEYGRAAFETTGPRQFEEPPLAGVGLVLDRIENQLWALGVLQPSPAASAGLLPGDWLLAIDGADATGAPAHALESLLAAPVGATREISVLRDGEVLRVRLGAVELL